MIQFSFDYNNILNQIVLAVAILILPVQLWLLVFRGRSSFSGRLLLRLGLNLLLWTTILALILQPYIRKEQASGIGVLVGDDVPAAFSDKLKDSLKTAEVLDLSDIHDVENLSVIDTLVLAGQDFGKDVFEKLLLSEHRPALKWIPYYGENQVRDINWKGILRKGEMQVLKGKIASDKDQMLSVRYGDQVLDSVKLHKGDNSFKLSFPVFTEGRTLALLNLDKSTLDTVRFFSRAAEILTFQFILDNPDFETRNLATWLGKNGHSVLYTATLSKDVESRESINKAKDPNVIITDARNASHSIVKKSHAAGKSVLFINLTNPVAEVQQINAALGTKLAVQKISQEETVTVSPGLAALPFQFVQSDHYVTADKLPVAVERVKGSVGVSLLSETFPLMLAGDSTTYQMVWNRIIAAIHPATASNIEATAPLFKDVRNNLHFNNFAKRPKQVSVGNDTVFLNHSAVNGKSTMGNFRALQSGWLAVSDTLHSEIYVEETNSNVSTIKNFIGSYTFSQNQIQEIRSETLHDLGVKQKFSEWVWLGLILLCLTAIWVEAKL